MTSERVSVQVSSEDTFETDLHLHELAPHIQRLAEKTWAGQQRTGRVARTVVLKLKTAAFQSLTRSHTPTLRPTGAAELAQIACDLRQRLARPTNAIAWSAWGCRGLSAACGAAWAR